MRGNEPRMHPLGLAGGILALIIACAERKHIEPEPPLANVQAAAAMPADPERTVASEPATPPTPSFELNDKERLMVRQLLTDDFAGFGKGWVTVFGASEAAKDYVVVSANELQNEYERNEVAGDRKYRGKRLALRGTVAEIKRSIGENYFVHLKGGSNQFNRPLAKMADGYVAFLAELEKGQTIQLFCVGAGMLMGSAVAAECVPADVWVEGMVNTTMLEVPKLVGSDKGYTSMVVVAVAATELMKETSPCFSPATKLGDASCSKDLAQLFGKPKAKKGSSRPKLSEATQARLKTIPGSEPYLHKIAAQEK